MQKVISKRTISIQQQEDIKLSAHLFEEFAQIYGIPKITINQVHLILLELLSSICTKRVKNNKISLTFKLFEEGSLSIKIVHQGLAFNPFEENILHSKCFFGDFRINTLSFHLTRKYMDLCTYHYALDYNIIYMKKERV